MKILKYQLMREYNHGTDEEPNIVQTFSACEIQCSEATFESNYALAQREAYNGEVTVEDVPDPEPTPEPSEPSVWDELDAAYQEGVNDV